MSLAMLNGFPTAVRTRCLVSGGEDGTVRMWTAASPEEVAQWEKEERESKENLRRLYSSPPTNAVGR